jgi:2-succinyl-6-hydroxy-2,4-cyclohexadiene-1-carboxylate synthase
MAQDESLAAFIEHEGVEAFVECWQALPLFASQQKLPPDVREPHRAARLRNRPLGLANSLRGMGTGVQPSLWDRLGELTLPVLLVVGSLDEKFVAIARQMSAAMPQVQVATVPGAGHTVHLEQPARYAGLISDWLAELSQTK